MKPLLLLIFSLCFWTVQSQVFREDVLGRGAAYLSLATSGHQKWIWFQGTNPYRLRSWCTIQGGLSVNTSFGAYHVVGVAEQVSGYSYQRFTGAGVVAINAQHQVWLGAAGMRYATQESTQWDWIGNAAWISHWSEKWSTELWCNNIGHTGMGQHDLKNLPTAILLRAQIQVHPKLTLGVWKSFAALRPKSISWGLIYSPTHQHRLHIAYYPSSMQWHLGYTLAQVKLLWTISWMHHAILGETPQTRMEYAW
jgi:hypothetical protein